MNFSDFKIPALKNFPNCLPLLMAVCMVWRKLNGSWRRTATWISLFSFVLYFEFLTYEIHAWTWQKLSCPQSSHCTSILLVADPQILGENDEPNWITIWDNDRYLRRTFSSALAHSQPEAVIFLGDLMDEGNKADDFEFQRYIDRFFTIFPKHSLLKTLYLPGDNDIGGENGDPILPSVVQRFQHSFHKKSELIVGSCHILKINPVLEPMPHPQSWQEALDSKILIAVSHFPLLGTSTPFTTKMLKNYKPDVVFSAHSHLSRLRGPSMSTPSTFYDVLGPMPLSMRNQSRTTIYEDAWSHPSNVHEIEVPTCSYRMGVANMGYGYALVDETKKELLYEVLWLPQRMYHLQLYLLPLGLLLILVLWWCLCAPCRMRHHYNLLNSKFGEV